MNDVPLSEYLLICTAISKVISSNSCTLREDIAMITNKSSGNLICYHTVDILG